MNHLGKQTPLREWAHNWRINFTRVCVSLYDHFISHMYYFLIVSPLISNHMHFKVNFKSDKMLCTFSLVCFLTYFFTKK